MLYISPSAEAVHSDKDAGIIQKLKPVALGKSTMGMEFVQVAAPDGSKGEKVVPAKCTGPGYLFAAAGNRTLLNTDAYSIQLFLDQVIEALCAFWPCPERSSNNSAGR